MSAEGIWLAFAVPAAIAIAKAFGQKEYIQGGLSSGMRPAQFDHAQLERGTKVELEHTNDWRIAREIAMDHLVEDANYYVKLAKMEGSAAKRGDQRRIREALDRWNGDKNRTWNEIAWEFEFPSEPAAMAAVNRYAKRHGLHVRTLHLKTNDTLRQEALDMLESGKTIEQVQKAFGYKTAESTRRAISSARRTRKMDGIYGRENNPLRSPKKP